MFLLQSKHQGREECLSTTHSSGFICFLKVGTGFPYVIEIGTALQKNWRDDGTNKERIFRKCKPTFEKIRKQTVFFLLVH